MLYAANLSGLEQRGEFSGTVMLTDRPTIPAVFKISTMSVQTESEQSCAVFLS